MSKANDMLSVLNSDEKEYILDQDNQLHHVNSINKSKEIISVDREEFKEFCLCEYYEQYGDTISDTAYRQALSTLKGIKKKQISDREHLYIKVAYKNDVIWHQLSSNKIVRISTDGVTIVEECPVYFKVFNHQESLPVPDLDSENYLNDLYLIFKYANITDNDQRLLFIASLIFGFISDVPHPFDLVIGAPGSAKTTTSLIKKSLIDPVHHLKGFSVPKNENDYLLTASQHHVVPIDNMPLIKNWQSDMFCKSATGDATSKRKLYTDNDQVLYRVKCCLVLNGLTLPTAKSDFLDRSLLFSLERVSEMQRKEEYSLLSQFNADKPKILGAIYKILSKTLEIKDDIKVKQLHRMADFTKWGCAIARAMGHAEEDFLRAYSTNRGQIRQELGSISCLIEVVKSYLDSTDETVIVQTPSALLSSLNHHGIKMRLDTEGMPVNAVHLSIKLIEFSNIFEELGILVQRGKSGERKIILKKLPSYCPQEAKKPLSELINSYFANPDRRHEDNEYIKNLTQRL